MGKQLNLLTSNTDNYSSVVFPEPQYLGAKHRLMSYNCRSYPDIDGLVNIIEHYRQVEVKEKEYRQSRGGKGSVSGSKEYLLICRKKS